MWEAFHDEEEAGISFVLFVMFRLRIVKLDFGLPLEIPGRRFKYFTASQGVKNNAFYERKNLMQRKRRISDSVLLWSLVFQLFLTASCTQTQRQEAGPVNNGGGQREKAADTKSTASPSEDKASVKTNDGLQLTVLSIERMKEREVLPGFPQKMGAKEGYEFAMVQLKVKVLAAGKKLDVTQLELRDAKENKYRCALVATDLCDAKPGEETTCELPFLVPKGVTLTKLQVGAEFIDLAKVEKR